MKKESEARKEYKGLLKTGMFFELYPNLSGNYELDKDFWRGEYKRLTTNRKRFL